MANTMMKKKAQETGYTRLWDALTQPHASLKDVAQRHRARLLAGLTLVLLVTNLGGLIWTIPVSLSEGHLEDSYLLMGFALATIVGYALSRTRHFAAGIMLLMTALSTAGYVNHLLGISDSPLPITVLSFAPMAFLVGIVLLTVRGVFVLAGINIAVPVILWLVFQAVEPRDAGMIAGITMTMGVLLLIVNSTRDAIERDRLAEINTINNALQSMSSSLEARVLERTRELALAAEVGRRISMVRDTGQLLAQAVELIGEHFNLYYTQIYLVDSAGRSLILRAGTGEVGKELLRRAHRLLIDLTSANGTAVVERRPVIIGNTLQSKIFLPHALLPDTRSEMVIPLMAGNRVLGALDLQSSRTGDLTDENLAVFETLAGQLASALINAELFEQVQQTLAEVEAHNRRNIREGWDDFLDGIDSKERIGYAFDQNGVKPLTAELQPAADGCALNIPIRVAGEPVGAFQMVAEQPWKQQDAALVDVVAAQVAQQIENLRLLGQAERYRRETEKAVRRLTREEWEAYSETSDGAGELGFVYSDGMVAPGTAGSNGHAPAYTFDISVQDEAIGQFGIAGLGALSPEDAELVHAVTGQLGAHLENMRLYTNAQQELVERRRIEQQLESQSRTLQAVLDNMPAGVFMVEAPSGRPILANRRAEEFLGRGISPDAAGDVLTEVFPCYKFGTDELYPKEDLPSIAAMSGLSTVIDDMEVRRPDGSTLLLQVNGSPVYDASGNIAATVVVLLDITELHKANEEVRRTEALYRQIMDSINEFILVKGDKSHIVWANKAFRDYYGMSNDQLKDMIDSPIVEPDYTQQYVKDDEYVFTSGKTLYIAEEPVTRFDGETRPFQTVKSPIFDQNGSVVMTVGVSRDITEAKQTQDALENERRKLARETALLRSLIDSVPDLIFYKDLDGIYLGCNTAFSEFAGVKEADLVGKTDFDLFPHDVAEFFREQDQQMIAQRAKRNNEEWVNYPDGRRVLLDTLKTPFYNMDGAVLGLIGISRDITERRMSQEAIAKRAAELATVSQVATTVATIQKPDEMLQTVVDLTKQAFSLYHAHIYLMNEAGDMLALANGAGEIGRQMVAEGRSIALDAQKSLVARAARSRSGVIVNNVRSDPEFLPHPLLPETYSEMAVPLLVGDQVLGVLDVQSDEINRFTDDDVLIETTLAAQVAIALQNARQYQQTQASEQLVRMVIDSTPDWIFIKDQQHRFRLVNQGYANSLRLPVEEIIGKNDLELGFPEELVKGSPEKGIRGFWADDRKVMDGGETVLFPDDPVIIDGKMHVLNTLKTPLRDANGSVWGVLAFARDVTEREEVLAETARQYNFTRSLTEARDLQDILAQVVETTHLPGVSRAFLYTFKEDSAGVVTDVEVHAAWSKDGDPLPFQVGMRFNPWEVENIFAPMRTPQPRFVEDTGDDGRQRGIFASLTLPLWMGSQFIGVISLQMPFEHHFTEEEKRPCASIAQQASIAVHSRMLFEETLTSEVRFRSTSVQLTEAMEAAKMANWEFDVASGSFIFNDAYYKLLGITAEEAGGYHMPTQVFAEKYTHPDSAPETALRIQDALQTNDPNYRAEFEARLLMPGGGYKTVTVTLQVEKDEQGRTVRLFGANQDITERKQTEAAMENQRRTLQAVLDNMPAGVFMVEAPSGKPILSNRRAEEFLGRGISPHAVGDDLNQVYQAFKFGTDELYPPQEMPVVAGMFGQSKVISDMEVRRPDGTRILLQVNGSPVYDAGGNVMASVVVFQDITAAHQTQELMAKRAVELATVAEVSTRVSTIQNPDEMLQTVVDLTKQAFGLYHAHIYLVNEAGDTLVLARGAGEVGREMVSEGRQITLDTEKSLVARSARSRSGVIVNDVRQETDFLPHPLLPGTRSEMAVPMIAGDRLLGVMDVQDETVSRFTLEDVNIMTTLAAQVAVSLQNARSFARAQRQAEREALINAISERIQATSSVENALQVAVREIGRALGAQHTAIRLGLERKNEGQ